MLMMCHSWNAAAKVYNSNAVYETTSTSGVLVVRKSTLSLTIHKGICELASKQKRLHF
jgi:hypothetical protein